MTLYVLFLSILPLTVYCRIYEYFSLLISTGEWCQSGRGLGYPTLPLKAHQTQYLLPQGWGRTMMTPPGGRRDDMSAMMVGGGVIELLRLPPQNMVSRAAGGGGAILCASSSLTPFTQTL